MAEGRDVIDVAAPAKGRRRGFTFALFSSAFLTVFVRVGSLGATMFELLPKIFAGITLLIVAVALYQEIERRSVVIDAIAIPHTLEDSGLTPDVAAKRLQDAIRKVYTDTKSSLAGPDIAIYSDVPNISVPATGLSIEAIANFIRSLIRSDRRLVVTGEVMKDGGQLTLRLRINGTQIAGRHVDDVRPTFDELATLGAEDVVGAVSPYILAAYHSDKNPTLSLDLAQRLIATSPDSDPLTPWSYNLVGTIRDDQHDVHDAISHYLKAIERAPREGAFHVNLGMAYSEIDERDKALAEFLRARELIPKDAPLRLELASFLVTSRELDRAEGEVRAGIAIEPADANLLALLGAIQREKNDLVSSDETLRRALMVDRMNDYALTQYGITLRAQGRLPESTKALTELVARTPGDAEAHRQRMLSLRAQGRAAEAYTELATIAALQWRQPFAREFLTPRELIAWVERGRL